MISVCDKSVWNRNICGFWHWNEFQRMYSCHFTTFSMVFFFLFWHSRYYSPVDLLGTIYDLVIIKIQTAACRSNWVYWSGQIVNKLEIFRNLYSKGEQQKWAYRHKMNLNKNWIISSNSQLKNLKIFFFFFVFCDNVVKWQTSIAFIARYVDVKKKKC